MANRIQLKSYFETGDKPTQAQFAELIDSLALVTELSSANLATLAQALAGLDNTKAMSPFLVKSVLLDWIINDLTTGGTQKLLSAEQGKILQALKADKTFGLDATQSGTWKTGLGIGKEIVRSGKYTSTMLISSSLLITNIYIPYSTISGFNSSDYSVLITPIGPSYTTTFVNPSIHKLDPQIYEFTDSYLRVNMDILFGAGKPSFYPKLNWAIIKIN
jgi:hypothetical protein